MKVLGLDPGITTGWTVLDLPEDYKIKLKDNLTANIHQGTITYEDIRYELEVLLQDVKEVVYEEFTLYKDKAASKTHSNFEEVQVIGVIKSLCASQNKKIFRQYASHVKQYYTDDRLKQLGFVKMNKHAKDALRHVLYYWDFNKGKESNVKTIK